MTDYRLLDKNHEFAEVLGELDGCSRYAVDTEFVREKTYYAKLAVVQLAWENPCTGQIQVALLDALKLDLRKLRPLMESDALALVHAGSQDLPILKRVVGVAPQHVFDTQIAGAFLGHGLTSLKRLVEEELGQELSKGAQLTDWTRRPLSEKSLKYAASDVLHLGALFDTLTEQLERRGRLSWAQQERDEMVEAALSERPLSEAWWRLKGANRLRGKNRGVAQSLAAYRVTEAQRRDVPAKRVLSDLSILAMASTPPNSAQALNRVRGLNRPSPAFAEGILRAIKTGLALQEDELCLPSNNKTRDEDKAASALCLAFVHQLAQDEGIDQALLATRKDVERFLADRPSRLDNGWRREFTRGPLTALIKGRAAVGLEAGRLKLYSV